MFHLFSILPLPPYSSLPDPPPYFASPPPPAYTPGRRSSRHSARSTRTGSLPSFGQANRLAEERQRIARVRAIPGLPDFDRNRTDIATLMEADRRCFAADRVDTFYALHSTDLKHLIDARLAGPRPMAAMVPLGAGRLREIRNYQDTYPHILSFHRLMRGAGNGGIDDNVQILVGHPIHEGVLNHAGGVDVPISSIRVYAHESNLYAARTHTRFERYPDLYARPLPSAMDNFTETVFNDARILMQAGAP